jgi:hypothetical protein
MTAGCLQRLLRQLEETSRRSRWMGCPWVMWGPSDHEAHASRTTIGYGRPLWCLDGNAGPRLYDHNVR